MHAREATPVHGQFLEKSTFNMGERCGEWIENGGPVTCGARRGRGGATPAAWRAAGRGGADRRRRELTPPPPGTDGAARRMDDDDG